MRHERRGRALGSYAPVLVGVDRAKNVFDDPLRAGRERNSKVRVSREADFGFLESSSTI